MPSQLLLTWLGSALLCSSLWAFDHSHSKWNEVLKKYRTEDSRVRYKALKADLFPGSQHGLDDYLKELSAVKSAEYETWTKDQKIAFLINAYNAFTIKLIVDKYPVESIKDIGGLFKSPWKQEFFSLLEGKIKSLDPIEHEFLRKQFSDARIHAALNCASRSCPQLQKRAFTAEGLDSQLDYAIGEWIRDTSRNHYDYQGNTMTISKIFDWFKADFEKSFGGVHKTIERYGSPTAKNLAKSNALIKYLPYDWKLNEAAQ